jgi:hypothetical protein
MYAHFSVGLIFLSHNSWSSATQLSPGVTGPSGLSTTNHCRSRPNRSDFSLREMPLLVGRCLLGRRRECRRKLQPPLSKGQPPHATVTQSDCERRSQDQRKQSSRSCIAARSRAWDTQSSHRGHCPSAVSTDLADPAPGSPLRRTRPSRHQAVKAKAHGENDPATPKSWLSDRTTESSTQPSTSAVIFEPGRLGQHSQAKILAHLPPYNPALALFRFRVGWLWHRALSRRSQNGRVLWDRMRRLIARWLPLPTVCHPYPLRRMGVVT